MGSTCHGKRNQWYGLLHGNPNLEKNVNKLNWGVFVQVSYNDSYKDFSPPKLSLFFFFFFLVYKEFLYHVYL